MKYFYLPLLYIGDVGHYWSHRETQRMCHYLSIPSSFRQKFWKLATQFNNHIAWVNTKEISSDIEHLNEKDGDTKIWTWYLQCAKRVLYHWANLPISIVFKENAIYIWVAYSLSIGPNDYTFRRVSRSFRYLLQYCYRSINLRNMNCCH